MATEIILPKVDMDMATGKISRWLVAEGASVKQGDVLFEIETDKAAMEIEAPASGTLRNVVAMEGIEVPVGYAVAWIYAEGEQPSDAPPSLHQPGEKQRDAIGQHAATKSAIKQVTGFSTASSNGAIRATPLARRLARQWNIDLTNLSGSGPNGRIQGLDIETAGSSLKFKAPVAPPPGAALTFSIAQNRQETPGGSGATWLRRGDGIPIVVIHGFGSEAASWRPFLSAFDYPGPILSLDLPGHGGAVEAPANGFDDLVAHAEAQLAALGVQIGHLAGHSLGGAVATALAAGSALETRSLFLLAPAGFGPEINTTFTHGFAGVRDEEALRRWMRELVADPTVFSDSFIKATARVRADGRLAEAQTRLASCLFSEETQLFSVRALVDHLAIPVKIVAGTADRVIPNRHSGGLPGLVAVHLFPGLGHMPHLEDRVSVARLMRELVQSSSHL